MNPQSLAAALLPSAVNMILPLLALLTWDEAWCWSGGTGVQASGCFVLPVSHGKAQQVGHRTVVMHLLIWLIESLGSKLDCQCFLSSSLREKLQIPSVVPDRKWAWSDLVLLASELRAPNVPPMASHVITHPQHLTQCILEHKVCVCLTLHWPCTLMGGIFTHLPFSRCLALLECVCVCVCVLQVLAQRVSVYERLRSYLCLLKLIRQPVINRLDGGSFQGIMTLISP